MGMLVYEYKLRLATTQRAAIDAAIRTTQFVRNKALRLWMDGRDVGRGDLQALCAQLAQEFPLRFLPEFHGTASRRRSRLAGDCPLL